VSAHCAACEESVRASRSHLLNKPQLSEIEQKPEILGFRKLYMRAAPDLCNYMFEIMHIAGLYKRDFRVGSEVAVAERAWPRRVRQNGRIRLIAPVRGGRYPSKVDNEGDPGEIAM
jgi:hypothetical protein